MAGKTIIRNSPSDRCFQTKQNVSDNGFSQNRGLDLIKVPTFLHEGRHFLCKRSLYSYPYIPMYIRIHANETRNICLWSREYMQMQPDLPCKGICKGGLTVLMCQLNCLIGNKMSGKIETGCYFDLSEYLCWRKYRKAFSSLYKKSIEEISCWKEKNYSLNRTMVLIFGFYDMV